MNRIMVGTERFGTLKCIDVIRSAYFQNTIRDIIGRNKKILFVGGGTGRSLADYLQCDIEVTFTDVDSDAIKFAKNTYNNCNIEFNCCSAYSLPYRNFSYDIVVSTLNGSYFNRHSLMEFKRVVKVGGLIILSETTPEYISYLNYRGRYINGYILSSDYTSKIKHPFVYTQRELIEMSNILNLECMRFDYLTPNRLIPYEVISRTICDFADFLDVNTDDVPLLYYMILKKGGM